MEEQTKVEVETNDEGSATPEVTTPPKEERDYKTDMFKFKEQARSAQTETDSWKSKYEKLQEEKLVASQNYKELYERAEAGKVEALAKVENYEIAYVEDRKKTAIEQAAIKAGVDPQYLEFIHKGEQSMVDIETTSEGRVLVNGAKEYVEHFKENFPRMFQSTQAPYINNNNPEYTPAKKLSPLEILKIQKDNPQRYKKIMQERINN